MAPDLPRSPSDVISISAIVVADLDGILVSESAIAAQGCSLRTDRRGRVSLRFPRGGRCLLWRENGLMRLPAQIVRPPGSPPRLALGLPPGCGEPVRAFLDTAAAFTVVGARHSDALTFRHGRPGRALLGVGGHTPSVDCGELSLTFHSDIKVPLNKPSASREPLADQIKVSGVLRARSARAAPCRGRPTPSSGCLLERHTASEFRPRV